MSTLARGLYAITPDEPDTAALLGKVRAALAGGATTLQYRNKTAHAALRQAQVEALLPLCRAAGVALIVNDDLHLAVTTGADGLHLGGTDGDPGAARRRLGNGRLLGISCYDRFELAEAAQAAGADYVAFGSVFPSATKPQAVRASLALFGRARIELDRPAVAIGGITIANAPAVIAAGAHAVAVIGALFDSTDVAAGARGFSRLFHPEVA